jgi:hypothetical protein
VSHQKKKKSIVEEQARNPIAKSTVKSASRNPLLSPFKPGNVFGSLQEVQWRTRKAIEAEEERTSLLRDGKGRNCGSDR